jgi:hypothetical protein
MTANPLEDGYTASLMHALREVACAGASAVAAAAMTMAMRELKPSDVVTNARVTQRAVVLDIDVELLLSTQSQFYCDHPRYQAYAAVGPGQGPPAGVSDARLGARAARKVVAKIVASQTIKIPIPLVKSHQLACWAFTWHMAKSLMYGNASRCRDARVLNQDADNFMAMNIAEATQNHPASEMAILQFGIISITLSHGYSQSC